MEEDLMVKRERVMLDLMRWIDQLTNTHHGVACSYGEEEDVDGASCVVVHALEHQQDCKVPLSLAGRCVE
jgi:hypothetical protein